MARLASCLVLALLAACGGATESGSPRLPPGPEIPAVIAPNLPSVEVGTEVELLAGAGFTSHAVARSGAGLVAVAARDDAGGTGAELLLVRVSADGVVSSPRAIELYPDRDRPGLAVASLAADGNRGIVAFADQASVDFQIVDLGNGDALSGGSTGGSPPPPLPPRPSAARGQDAYLIAYNGWGTIDFERWSDDHTVEGFSGFLPGVDPWLAGSGDALWLGWQDDGGAVVSPLEGTHPPLPTAPIELGPAAGGPTLAIGSGQAVALTWGDALEAHAIALDPPALAATSTVASGPITGRPAVLPWDLGFLVIWADAAGTTIRGRLLDAGATPLGAADGFVLRTLAEPAVLDPAHVAGDADGAWITWRSSTGLHAVPLSRGP